MEQKIRELTAEAMHALALLQTAPAGMGSEHGISGDVGLYRLRTATERLHYVVESLRALHHEESGDASVLDGLTQFDNESTESGR